MPQIDRTLLFSAVSGVLLAAAFPRPDLYWLAWVALIPLLLVMERRPFAAGFTCGLAFFGMVLYWLNIVMTTYGGLNLLLSLIAYLLLVIYLAAFFGLASWLACAFQKQYRLPYLLTLPVVWVALEYLRGLLLTGFPWALLGYSQQSFPLAIQSADVTGVYGVSLLLVLVNCALAGLIHAPRAKLPWLGAAITLLICCSHFGYGLWRAGQSLDVRPEQLRVALIQGNVDQTIKWNPDYRQATVEKYLRLTRQAAAAGTDLLIWPEAATPFFLQENIPLAEQVRQVPVRYNSYLLVGSPAYQQMTQDQYHYFNSAYLLSPQGEELGRSDKIHLVPFGEYVPLSRLLFFINKLVTGVGDFTPGTVTPLPLDGHSLGVLICYEVIFPELARDYVRQGSSLLVNITNDAWFGRSSAPYQHLAMARFRAIENRIWLARAANTGISALIAPSGEITVAGPIFAELQLAGTVGLGSEPTFYTRFGDLFAWACLGTSVLGGLALALRVRKKSVFISR